MNTDKWKSSDQWLSDGKCNLCRRKNYCSKKCKPCIAREEYERASAINRAMFRAIDRLKTKGA